MTNAFAPRVWVVASVWAPKDESDSFGEYPLSALAVFGNLDDAKEYAEKEIANHTLTSDTEDTEDAEDEGEEWEDSNSSMPLTEQKDGNWECRINNYYEIIWVQITLMVVR